MSKIKMSFSLIIAIFLVGILSTAAFAQSTYSLKAYQQGSQIMVYFKGTAASTNYTVELKNGTITVDSQTVTTDSSKNGVYTYNMVRPDDYGQTFTVNLKQTATDLTALESTTLTTKDYLNNGMASDGHPNTNDTTVTVDVNGSGLHNDNQTGYDQLRKNRQNPKQQVHGFYQNNTNSCASCHQTHTAANGESLLFKDGVYSTCSACHDGTTGAYNSFSPVSSSMTSSISGTFNVQASGHNGSMHEADGSLKISAAPGGNKDGGQYDQEFDCASCHAAHGAGSAGENNLNTDPMGWGSVPYSATAGQTITYVKGHGTATITTTIDNKNGKLFNFDNRPSDVDKNGNTITNNDIIDLTQTGVSLPTTETYPYILVKQSLANQAAVDANFFYKRAIGTVTDTSKFPIQVIQTYRWTDAVTYDSTGQQTGGGYVPDYSLWNRELGYPFVANTVLKAGSTDLTLPTSNADLTVVWRDGFAYGSAVSTIDNAVISVGIDVETTGNIADLYDSTRTATFVPDSGTEMSKYCASCHVDYASVTRTDETGVYTTAHRHATLQDKLTCVRCHYAHGSEAQIMHDANDNTYFDLTAAGKVFDSSVTGNTDKATSYFVDPNPSSALKRYTGMSVCYACHGKGEQFVGNPNTNKADTTTGEFLKGGDPGATRTVISK